MKILSRYRVAAIANRLKDEAIYEKVLEEVNEGFKRPGLWAKAIASSDGNSERAYAAYIRLRAQSIKDEINMASSLPSLNDRDLNPGESKVLPESHIDTLLELGYRISPFREDAWKVVKPGSQITNYVYGIEKLAKLAEDAKGEPDKQ